MHFRTSLKNSIRLTLFGRSLLIVVSELLANAVCWIVAGILFGRGGKTQTILSLASLAWTIGLRHALDADHIRCCLRCAIDNATRNLISLGQLPVTCGLFFSLGHSTIVIVVNVAIAISTDIYDKLNGVGSVGAIVGTAVSGTFLFIVGLANCFILWKIIQRRQLAAKRYVHRLADGENQAADDIDTSDRGHHNNMLMVRILGPIIHFVDRPWKMYPVGVLFGFGFDTASSIALLAISAMAKKGPDGKQISPADIVILPLLFTAGMTLIDTLDSILMLYSYAGFPQHAWAIFDHGESVEDQENEPQVMPFEVEVPVGSRGEDGQTTPYPHPGGNTDSSIDEIPRTNNSSSQTSKPKSMNTELIGSRFKSKLGPNAREDRVARDLQVKRNTMSGLSIILTFMSIIVAFSISIIEVMGLIGANCRACRDAASAQDRHGGGLAGSWWRFWAKANDNLGLIGAGIVGSFIFVVLGGFVVKLVARRFRLKPAPRLGFVSEAEGEP